MTKRSRGRPGPHITGQMPANADAAPDPPAAMHTLMSQSAGAPSNLQGQGAHPTGPSAATAAAAAAAAAIAAAAALPLPFAQGAAAVEAASASVDPASWAATAATTGQPPLS